MTPEQGRILATLLVDVRRLSRALAYQDCEDLEERISYTVSDGEWDAVTADMPGVKDVTILGIKIAKLPTV